MGEPEFIGSASLAFSEPADPFAKLPALAERLGVSPKPKDSPPSVVVYTRDGQSYDLFDLINAALDRLDAPDRHSS